MKDMHRLPPAPPETVARRIFTLLHGQALAREREGREGREGGGLSLQAGAANSNPSTTSLPPTMSSSSSTNAVSHPQHLGLGGGVAEEKVWGKGDEKVGARRRPLDVLNVGKENGLTAQ